MLVKTPIPRQGASGGPAQEGSLRCILASDRREYGYATQPSVMCPRTSKLKDELHPQRVYGVSMPSSDLAI